MNDSCRVLVVVLFILIGVILVLVSLNWLFTRTGGRVARESLSYELNPTPGTSLYIKPTKETKMKTSCIAAMSEIQHNFGTWEVVDKDRLAALVLGEGPFYGYGLDEVKCERECLNCGQVYRERLVYINVDLAHARESVLKDHCRKLKEEIAALKEAKKS